MNQKLTQLFPIKKTAYYLVHVFIFCFFIKVVAGNNDTINNTNLIETQKYLIRDMNEEQLTDFVDQLFEKDTVFPDWIFAVNAALANLKCNENDLTSFPSSHIYTDWEAKDLFPENGKFIAKNDTSFTLFMQHENHQNFCTPSNGPITSNYGWRGKKMHKGIDIDLIKGDAVVAAFDGMVRIAKRDKGFGNVVIIRHYNGFETVYAHLSKINVKSGQLVNAGSVVGFGGSTGHSTGAHLHFEVRFKGIPINPKFIISFSESRLVADEFVITKNRTGLLAYPLNSKFYSVKKGETILQIAKCFGTTIKALREKNNLYGKYLNLKEGDLICLDY